MAPASTANATGTIDRVLASIRSQTETKTAKTVINEAKTLRKVMICLAPPEIPVASTKSEDAVCPAIEATE